jgi:cell division protein FtsB
LAASGSSNDPALREALARYAEQLAASQEELNDDISGLQRMLDKYRASGKGMEQVVARYVELTKEKEELRQQIRQLETGR